MKAFHLDIRRRRARNAQAIAFVALFGLGAGFFWVQLVQSPVYAVETSTNRARAVGVEAARGVVVDRWGEPLADNVTAHVLSLLPVPYDTAVATLIRLAPHLGLAPEQLAELTARQRRKHRRLMVVSRDMPLDLVEFLDNHRSLFPGVLVETRPKRDYPAGADAAHLLASVEQAYDRRLMGRDGLRFIEVDPVGRLVGPLPHRSTVPPAAGDTLHLTIDLRLQREVGRLIPDGVRASVVALAPATGVVLVLYSSPGFDPHDPPTPCPPDRAMGTVYRAGDMWQVVTAATALRYGIVEPESTQPLSCRGGMRYGARYLPCRDRRGHGALDLAGALEHSCDVYFYQLGLKIGLDRLLSEGVRLGFGAPTGVDLPGERAGTFPPAAWIPTDSASASPDELGMRLAAGDAPVEVSPLRMAHLFGVLAGPGGIPVPRVVGAVVAPVGSSAGAGPGLGADAREWLRETLRRGFGPSRPGPGQLDGWDWGGKASVADAAADGPDWFVGIGGAEGGGAEIVVVVVVEERTAGVDAAAVARRVAEIHLRQGEPRADVGG